MNFDDIETHFIIDISEPNITSLLYMYFMFLKGTNLFFCRLRLLRVLRRDWDLCPTFPSHNKKWWNCSNGQKIKNYYVDKRRGTKSDFFSLMKEEKIIISQLLKICITWNIKGKPNALRPSELLEVSQKKQKQKNLEIAGF